MLLLPSPCQPRLVQRVSSLSLSLSSKSSSSSSRRRSRKSTITTNSRRKNHHLRYCSGAERRGHHHHGAAQHHEETTTTTSRYADFPALTATSSFSCSSFRTLSTLGIVGAEGGSGGEEQQTTTKGQQTEEEEEETSQQQHDDGDDDTPAACNDNDDIDRPFRILGIQQIAIGSEDRNAMNKLWIDLLGLGPIISTHKIESENVIEDIIQIGGSCTNTNSVRGGGGGGGVDAANNNELVGDDDGNDDDDDNSTEEHNANNDNEDHHYDPVSSGIIEIDLMTPIDPDRSPKVHKPPLNHIGLWVDSLDDAVLWLTKQGVRFTPGGIRRGAAGYNVAFIHPKGNEQQPLSGNGVLIELVQAPTTTTITKTSLSKQKQISPEDPTAIAITQSW